ATHDAGRGGHKEQSHKARGVAGESARLHLFQASVPHETANSALQRRARSSASWDNSSWPLFSLSALPNLTIACSTFSCSTSASSPQFSSQNRFFAFWISLLSAEVAIVVVTLVASVYRANWRSR